MWKGEPLNSIIMRFSLILFSTVRIPKLIFSVFTHCGLLVLPLCLHNFNFVKYQSTINKSCCNDYLVIG